METSQVKWTAEQQQVFDVVGKNLLVSASAGSGKTTVMIEKIIRLMTSTKTPISNFLVVTFTRTSASDMKKKLIEKLLLRELDEFLLDQIENVETSDISTLHVFCSRLIQTYFYKIDIDPNFIVLDETQSKIIKERAISKVFEQCERNASEDFFTLFEIFQKKRSDNALKLAVFKFSEFLKSITDGNTWFKNTLESAYNPNLESNKCAQILNGYVSSQIKVLSDEASKLGEKCLNENEEKAYNYFVDLSSNLLSVNHKNSYTLNAKNLFAIKIAVVPKVDEQKPWLKQEISEFVTDARKQLKNFTENMISPDEHLLKTGVLNAKSHLEMLFTLTLQFEEQYSKLKREMGVLDFNDLEMNALKILESKEIQTAVQQKYKYVFVDEYQDINAVQEEIISKVSSQTNRFMVGDIKQSIYAFRLCDPQIFLGTLKNYSSESKLNKVIKLNANFRSDKKILKFVDEVFCDVMTEDFGGTDYKKDAQFVAGESNLDEPNSVNLCLIDVPTLAQEKQEAQGVYSVKEHEEETSEDTSKIIAEANLVASKITELTDKTKPDAIKRSDIAILISSRNPKITKFVSILKGFGIMVASGEKYDLMKKPYIEEIVNFVKLCICQNDDILMFKVLKSKLFNFSNNELVAIRKADLKANFFDLVLNLQLSEQHELKGKLFDFQQKLRRFSSLAKMLDLNEFVKIVVNEFKLKTLNLAAENGEQAVEDINRFLISLPKLSVSEFVLEYQNYAQQIDRETSGDAVKIMTIHASKGIEFKVVFLINLDNKINLKSTYGSLLFSKDLGVGLDNFNFETRTKQMAIPISAIRLLEKRKIVEEQQRVLYVALTRAVSKLFVICSKDKNKIVPYFPAKPTCFLDWFEPQIFKELNEEHNKNINFELYDICDLSLEQPQEKRVLMLSASGKKEGEFEYGFTKYTKLPIKTSVTKIISEADDEYQERVLSTEHNSSSAERGTAYHKLFQFIDFKSSKPFDEQIDEILKTKFSTDEVALVDKSLALGLLSQPFFAGLKASDFVLQEREFMSKISADDSINFNLSNTTSNDNFILQGVIDLVAINQNEITILDYKTGNLSNEKLEKYSLQLSLYAGVVERALQKKVTKKLLAFVDLKKIIEI